MTRTFRVVDKRGRFLWWTQEERIADGVTFSCSDFSDGAFLGITDAEKASALTRVAKGVST